MVLQRAVHIYDIETLKQLLVLPTANNPTGTIAFCPATGHLAYPSAARLHTDGEVSVLDTTSLRPLNVLQAHLSRLSCLAFNAVASLIATASDKVHFYPARRT